MRRGESTTGASVQIYIKVIGAGTDGIWCEFKTDTPLKTPNEIDDWKRQSSAALHRAIEAGFEASDELARLKEGFVA